MPLGYSAFVTAAITDVRLDLPRVASGKVREVFDAGDDLLMVATGFPPICCKTLAGA